MMFSFAGTAQEAGAGDRSGAVGILVRGSLTGRFYVDSFFHFFPPRDKTSRDQGFWLRGQNVVKTFEYNPK